jgi:hypothetical protein
MSGDQVIDTTTSALERIAAAAAILIAGYGVGVLARWLVGRLLRSRETSLGPSFVRLVRSSAYFWILALSVAGALIALGVPSVFVVAVGVAI